MGKNLGGFLCKAFIFLLPVWALFFIFVVMDPFRIFWYYDNYYQDRDVEISRDFVSTSMYEQNRERYGYDSFILGNSRSLAFLCGDWQMYLQRRNVPFHFDANGETVNGIWSKVRFIHERDKMRHVLMVLDSGTFIEDMAGFPESVSFPQFQLRGRWEFYAFFLKAFLTDLFFVKYLDYKITRTYRPYMKTAVDPRRWHEIPATNDRIFLGQEEEILNNPHMYYASLQQEFDAGALMAGQMDPRRIMPQQEEMLREIKRIFDEQKTSYHIVISPLWNKLSIHTMDLQLLQHIFGAARVHNYSGVNRFTAEISNYYESSHYRPIVARAILKEIYAPDNKSF